VNKVVFVDIDDTLVRSFGSTRIPMPTVIEQVRRLKRDGHLLYLWSSGGAAYCQSSAKELGIEDLFEAFLPKPTQYLDDQPLHEWRFCKHFYPLQASEI
jgi:hydroxymethylpyrimidine pyrophosphatase-like HAD family hydrolase